MKIRSIIQILLSCWLISLLVGCSSGSNTASGTGVGNPGKTTISFITRSSSNQQATDSFTVTTSDGLIFTIKEAFITAKEVYFIHESGSILKSGPYRFNAITGESEPAINFNELPDYSYTGLDFIVETDAEENDVYSLELSGTFVYNSQLRDFTIKSSIKGNQKDQYDLENGPLNLDFNLTNIFKIDLEVEQWLNNVEIKDSLDNNVISLNSDGSLTIDKDTDWKAAKEVAKRIKKNIFKSGKLTLIYQ